VIECVPIASVDVVNVVTPAERVPVPIVVVPSLNVTVPVGVPTPGATTATVAVNVTDWPKADGLTLDVSAVVVEFRFTTCDRTVDVLVTSFVLPPYTAVIGCVPTASVEVERVATPEPLSVPVPMEVAPSLNVTVPVGVPAPGATTATVAVNVTDCPNADGFTLEMSVVVVES
jgi:hypothetical protein